MRGERHDFHHLPEYARFLSAQEGGRAAAFLVRDSRGSLLAPVLVKPLPRALGAPSAWRDAVSPYGYGSPLLSRGLDGSTASGYLDAVARIGRRQGLVSTLFRLHPLLPLPPEALVRHGRVVVHGDTVVVRLDDSVEALRAEMRRNHRQQIEQLVDAGFTASIGDWTPFPEFGPLYRATMERVGAAEIYRFSDAYFQGLRGALGGRLQLGSVRAPSGDVAAMALFTETSRIVQCHLACSAERFARWAPSKLMIDRAAVWAKVRGNAVLHLGGGVGGAADALFRFKAGFSRARAPFATFGMVFDEARYRSLVSRARGVPGLTDANIGFFPEYRHGPPRGSPESDDAVGDDITTAARTAGRSL